MLFFSIARKNHSHLQKAMVFTEKGGFEPPDPGLAGQLLSREPDSASLAPLHRKKTEREGFEPPETFASAVFKTATIDHSDISPMEYQSNYDITDSGK